MARDAIGLIGITLEDDGKVIPEPSNLESINVENGIFSREGKTYLSLVDIDFDEYRRQNEALNNITQDK